MRPNSSKQSAAKHKARQSRSKRALFCIHLSFFLGWQKGFLLTVCLQLRAKRSRASPSFASCYALATAKGRPSPMPSPTPLHVRSCCAMRRLIWRCRAENLNLTFSGCGSRLVKFEARICKFDFKFESKMIRRSITRWI